MIEIQNVLQTFFGGNYMPAIGERIRKLRTERKMTQEMLAQKLNVTVSAVSQWESGRTLPDLTMLIPLCGLFSVSADDLLGIRSGGEKAALKEAWAAAEKLAAEGSYDAAFEELRQKIAMCPDSDALRMQFGLLFMKFCQKVPGREREKQALCAETEELVIRGDAIGRWGALAPENEAAADEFFLFFIRRRLSDRMRRQTDELLERTEALAAASKLGELRQLALKELKDAEEVGGPRPRLVGHAVALRLMEIDEKAYEEHADPALLSEIASCGKFVLEYNAALPLLIKALFLCKRAAERLGDRERLGALNETLRQTKEALSLFET